MASALSVTERVICLIGQGFGTGCSRWAPGTVGTLPGLVLAWFLWQAGPALYLVIMILVVIIAIWVSGRTANLLGVHDDPRIVIDESRGHSRNTGTGAPIRTSAVGGVCFIPVIGYLQAAPDIND